MSDANLKVDLSLDYAAEAEEYKDVEKQKTFLKNVFTNAINSAFKNGLGKEYLRRFRDIIKKIEAATEEVVDAADAAAGEGVKVKRLYVSLTPHEYAFMNEAFTKATWTPGSHPLVCQIYDLLEEAKK